MKVSPDYLNSLFAPIIEEYEGFEIEAFEILTNEFASIVEKVGDDPVAWQIEARKATPKIAQRLQGKLDDAQRRARNMADSQVKRASEEVQRDTDRYFTAQGKDLMPLSLGVADKRYLADLLGNLNNGVPYLGLARRNVNPALMKYVRQVTQQATATIVGGKKTVSQGVTDVLMKWADRGIPSEFTDAGGRVWDTGTYVRMVTRTATADIYNEERTRRMAEYDCHTVLVSSKPKARPACAPIQGQVVDVRPRGEADSGYPSVYDYGYGTPAGHRGCNCGHQWFPFIDGVNVNNQRYYEPEQAIRNEQIEQQRKALARAIKRTKKRLGVAEKMGNQEEAERLKRLLGRQSQRMNEFVKAHGLRRRYDLEKVELDQE